MVKKATKVAILGFDCAEPHLIKKHIDEGHLPNFKKVFGGGVLAENCLCPYPTITPPNWASIATGAWPGTHEVTDFHLHRAGTSQLNANIFQAFSSENCKAEFIWDRLDVAGYKCIVCNYPGSWPSKMKNGILVGGEGLDIDEHRQGGNTLDPGLTLGNDIMISTGFFPWATRIKFKEATGWKNLPANCQDPLDDSFPLTLRESATKLDAPTWHILATQSGDDGYDTVTVSPTKDYRDALFTLKQGQWSNKIHFTFKAKDGQQISATSRAKLLEISDDAEELRLVLTRFCRDEGWSNPPEIAKELVNGDGSFTFAGGLIGYAVNWFGLDTYAEMMAMHDDNLGDMATYLMKNKPWDFFCMHIHSFDWSYHSILTEMDENTCTDKQSYEEAWAHHLNVSQSQDRLLGRLMEAAGEDTLFVLVSDHGAVADGTPFNPYLPMIQKGLCVMEGSAHPDVSNFESEDHRELAKAFQNAGKRLGMEALELMTLALFNPDLSKTKALPQRTIYIYINLKGRDPGGIVEPADYEKVQQEIIDALYTYVDPTTGQRPVALALTKQDARILGLHSDAMGDVVYAVYPQFGGQHGPHLPSTQWGVGKLRSLLAFYGPGIKHGYLLERTSGLPDIVPTVCYMMNWPLPAQAEGGILYQALENPNQTAEELQKLKETLEKMESRLSGGEKKH